MQQQQNSTWLRDATLTAASIVILFTGLRYAQTLMVPFLLSLFIAIIAAGPVSWLKQRGLPVTVAVTLVLLAIIVLEALLAILLGSTVSDFTDSLPTYQAGLQEMSSGVVSWLSHHGLDVSKSGIANVLDPGAVMSFANTLLSGLSQVLGNILLIMFTVMFMLLEAWTIADKFKSIPGERSELVLARIVDIIQTTKQYTSIKTVTSLATGCLIWAGTAMIGLDFAVLWGFLAFLLNFIPNVGSIIAAIPAVLLALVQLGPMSALTVIILYIVVNTLIGSIIEPRFMGQKVGLSTLVVFLSLIFWGWFLGPVGMLLSVPLTMVVKFAAQSSEETLWLAILLDSEVKPADKTLLAANETNVNEIQPP